MTTQIGATPPNPYVTPQISSVGGILEATLIASLQPITTTLGSNASVTTSVNAETYNGTIPGPTLRLNVGDTLIVRLINNLPYPSGIHWHGIELANIADGTEVTQGEVPGGVIQTLGNGVMSGGTRLYKFKVPRPGIYWYHPHHHNSSNRVFRGLYGMIVVTDPNETTLDGNTLPAVADTKQIVLSDITVCTAPPNADYYASLAGAEWLSGAASQPGPTPANMCELPGAVDDNGAPAAAAYGAGDVPSLTAATGRINEGQRVLTNGVNVGARSGTPAAPGALALNANTYRLPVRRGQGLRLQIANCATTRYFRLRLTDGTGAQLNLVRVGGEGGVLDNAVLEGRNPPVPGGTFNPKYHAGEILIPPSVRADVVVAIPDGLAVGTVLTLWTRDFERLPGQGGWARVPTVPVMHLEVSADPAVAPAYTITGGPNGTGGTELRAKAGFPGALVENITSPATTGVLLTPAGGFVAPKLGMADQDIDLTSGTPSINGVAGNALHGPPPYPNMPHIGSTRYAEKDRLLQLTVTNATQAHHPFHLHGFSMQPVSLTRAGGPNFTWGYREFRDSIDVPVDYTLTFRVRLDDRPHVDGTTLGAFLGRWLFHCHIFFHHHRGMVGEFVVTDAAVKERPYVDVNGSWAYVPSPAPTRRGTFSSPEGNAVSLASTYGDATTVIGPLGTVTLTGPNTWSWTYPGGLADGTYYVYITATDNTLALQGQTVFRLKVGGLDDGSDIGDPHIRTVDGKNYDFQAVGEFTLLRGTDGLEVQARQTPVPTASPIVDPHSGLTSCVSINTAVAARIGPHRFSYQPTAPGSREMQLFVDGKPARLTERGLELDGGRISMYAVGSATALRVDYNNFTVLTVTPHFWNSNNVWYLNVEITNTDADMGLMGRIPAGTWLPLLPSGASVGPKPASLSARYTALYKTFANAWRLTDQTSLFVYAPGTSTKNFTDRDWPAEKPPCKLKPEFQIPGANPPKTGIDEATAKKLCKPVTVDDLHKACVFDVATTGDKTLVDGYLAAQEIRLKGTAVQIGADKPRTEPKEALLVTATVVALMKDRPTPTGKVTFLVDDVAIEGVELDKFGQASWKTDSLERGMRRIRAVYSPGGENGFFHPSSSPVLSHRVEKKPPIDRSKAPYQFHGLFYEACDCDVVCPCWLGSDPDGGECTGVFAWQIEKGSIDGIDVAGLLTVSVSYHSGRRDGPKQRVVILVDNRATRKQADALAAAFSGQYGGPLKELADLQGELLGVERAAISLRREGRRTILTVDDRILVDGTTIEGPSRRPMALNDGKLSNVLGTPATVGESSRFRVGLGAHGMELDLKGRSTMSGRFSYKYVPELDPGGSTRSPISPMGHR